MGPRKRQIDPRIGQRLKEYREHRGLTVRQLAEAAHVTAGLISHYENGYHRLSHERITDFARILYIRPSDLYQPPGSPLRLKRVRDLIVAVIANLAAAMTPSSRRKSATAVDDVFALNAAVVVATLASEAASGGEIFNLTTSGDDTSADISAISSVVNHDAAQIPQSMAETITDHARIVVEGKLNAVPKMDFKADTEATLHDGANAANALPSHSESWLPETGASAIDGMNTLLDQYTGGSSATFAFAADKEVSKENGFIVPETPNSNGDHFQLRAVADLKINDPDNFKFADHGHLGKASYDNDDSHPDKASHDSGGSSKAPHDADDHSRDKHPEKAPHAADKAHDNDSHPGKAASHDNDSHPNKPGKAHDDGGSHPGKAPHDSGSHIPHDNGNDAAKAALDLSEHSPHPPHPPPGHPTAGKDTVISDAASDQFIFGKGADHHKPDTTTEIDHTVPAAIQHLLDTAHDANAVSTPDPSHAAASHDMTKVDVSHHHGDFHLA